MLAAVGIALLALFQYIAPNEWASMAVWTGIVGVLVGLVCLIKPARRAGAAMVVAGLALLAAGMLWPAPVQRAEGKSKLDEIFPEYQFCEKHTQRIHASPERVAGALEQTTMDDIKAYYTLMRIRAFALGIRQQPKSLLPSGSVRILAMMREPKSPFVPLYQDASEIVMGLVGYARPYTQPPNVHDLAAFQAFHEPDSVRIAFNLLIRDDGGGWSTITSDTRLLVMGDRARRATGRYWRLVCPGSGMIRRMWLNAVEARAAGSRS